MPSTKKPQSKPRRPSLKEAKLVRENKELRGERDELLERETATGDILRMIASSPTDLQSVLDMITERAAKLCDAADAVMWRVDGEVRRRVAHFGSIPTASALGEGRVSDRGTVPGRAIVDCQTIHVHDLQAAAAEFPGTRGIALGLRTVLSTPLLREGVAIGAIYIRRREVRPFTEKQIKLLETFADQAVIAIENVRLFNELKESLEQQTATSEILGVIASSPTDIQPVLDTVAENAARVCGANDAVIFRVNGNVLERAAHYGPILWAGGEESLFISRGSVSGRAVVDRRTTHIHDMAAEPEAEFPEGLSLQRRAGHRTILATPLMREGNPIGNIMIRRTEVRPFSDKQIKLLETFADQAVIAIENVRLFKELQERNAELREALEHQTATDEVLGIISRSPTDVQPVLDAIVESAGRVCGIDNLGLQLREGNNLVSRAQFGPIPAGRAEVSVDEPASRWIREHGTLHIPDLNEQNDFQIRNSSGSRTFLFLPLRHKGEVVGTLTARRFEVRPFTPAQIKLLETFADQAVIAIENVRLFKEIQERNAELREALEHQTATAEVLGIISRSPTDVQPVLDAIVESAAKVCGIDDVVLRLNKNNALAPVAHFGLMPVVHLEISIDEPWIRWIRDHGTLHIPDIRAHEDLVVGFTGDLRLRSILVVCLRQQGELIGILGARRIEVRPFTPAQIKLLETFADQAVIAIENVRLFQELETRTR